jgi:hypothetical protein
MEIDRVLRALADPADDSLPAPEDGRLRDYWAGRLTPEESRELEGLLARSAAGRRRLLELAGVDRSLPLRRVRKAVLGQAPSGRRVFLSLAATAAMVAVAAAIVLALFTVFPRPRALPPGVAYEVSARGLAEVRSAEAVPGEVRAYPTTPLRILVRPRGDSPAGLSFALFRRQGGALRQVRQPEEVERVGDRGSATFAGVAAKVLATRAPGAYPLYVVVSTEQDLPMEVKVEPGRDPSEVLRKTGRLVYPVTVTLISSEESAR